MLHARNGFFKRRRHSDGSRNVFGAGSLASFLRSAENNAVYRRAFSHAESAYALGPVKFMGGKSEHINAVTVNVQFYVARRLNGVRVENNALFPANCADFRNGLNRAYLVVCVHNGNEAGLFVNSSADFFGRNNAVFVRRNESYFEALFSELFKRF